MYRHSLFCFGGYNGFTVLNDFYEYRFEPLVVPPPTLKSDLLSLVNNPTLRYAWPLSSLTGAAQSPVFFPLLCAVFPSVT